MAKKRRGEKRGRKKSRKVPFASQIPAREKKPRQEPPESSATKPPGWHFRSMDMDGPWSWSNTNEEILQYIKGKLSNFETMTWEEILGRRDHAIKVADISPVAQRRLSEINQDDIDELVSLHLSGLERVWGIRHNEYLRILWWDPRHEICPSRKKST
jgi:hypothetical protein